MFMSKYVYVKTLRIEVVFQHVYKTIRLSCKYSNMEVKNWVGTSIEDMCRGTGSFNFSSPSVSPSKYHTVLYELPVNLVTAPKPHYTAQKQHWDNDHVRMPFSPKNLFPIKTENGEEKLKHRWEIIQESLLGPISTSYELEAAINSYNTRLPKFTALHHFFEEILDEDESDVFFKFLLPRIIQLALQLPDIVPGNLPLLKKEHCKSVSLSQLQISSLLANAFLCTFPWRKDVSSSYPGANFIRLFAAHSRPKRINCIAEKFKCIFHYFRRVTTNAPVGVVTFERKFLHKNQMPRWDRLENNLGNTRIHISSTGTIEDAGHGFLQVDFANKYVGGGVLGFGCVQEEIRYVICPELIISRLFTEELGFHEALLIIGVERYSDYSGYGDTFVWNGNHQDETPFDNYGRRKMSVVAIDATRFNKPADQFSTSLILRELNKAYVGFHSRQDENLAPVATGNWGCGAFKGDLRLKFVIQLMACSAANRSMIYYTFDDSELRDVIYNIYTFLATNKITVCELWRLLCRFLVANLKSDSFFPFIQQAHFDNKNQPSISQMFSFNRKQYEHKTSGLSEKGATSPEKGCQPEKRYSPKKGTSPNTCQEQSSSKSSHKVTPSTSTERFLEREEKFDMSITEFDSDPDIIESSQDNESNKDLPLKRHKFNSKVKKRHADIVNLISVIDGKENLTSDNLELASLFEESIAVETANGRNSNCKDFVSIEMDMDDVTEEIPVKTNVQHSKEPFDNSSSKRKITDYFVKINK